MSCSRNIDKVDSWVGQVSHVMFVVVGSVGLIDPEPGGCFMGNVPNSVCGSHTDCQTTTPLSYHMLLEKLLLQVFVVADVHR